MAIDREFLRAMVAVRGCQAVPFSTAVKVVSEANGGDSVKNVPR